MCVCETICVYADLDDLLSLPSQTLSAVYVTRKVVFYEKQRLLVSHLHVCLTFERRDHLIVWVSLFKIICVYPNTHFLMWLIRKV